MRTDPDRTILKNAAERDKRGGSGPPGPLDAPLQPGHGAPALPPAPADEPAWSAAPIAANEGRIVAVPALEPDSAEAAAAVEAKGSKAGRQLLTGRAARMAMPAVSLSPTQMAWRKLKKNRLAVAGG